MKEQDKIKELFSEKLGNFSAPVNPELWTAIASKVAVSSSVAASGTSLLIKGIIGLGAASIIGVATYFALKTDPIQPNEIVVATPINQIDTDIQSNEIKSKTGNKEVASKNTKNSSIVNNNDTNNNNSESTTPRVTPEENHKTDSPVYVPKVRDANDNNPIPPVSHPVDNKKGENKSTEDNANTDNSPTDNGKKAPVKPILTAEITLLPNSFTPNGDRVNDEFYLEFEGDLLDFNIVILDKSNRTVFETKDPNFRWGGINQQGELTPKGSYYYIVTARDSNGNPINKYNSLSIER